MGGNDRRKTRDRNREKREPEVLRPLLILLAIRASAPVETISNKRGVSTSPEPLCSLAPEVTSTLI